MESGLHIATAGARINENIEECSWQLEEAQEIRNA